MDASSIVQAHPLGVKPSGNAFTADSNAKFAMGRLAQLTDELILDVLERLDGHALQHIASTCRACYAFGTFEDLWRAVCLNSKSTISAWRGSWRATYLRFKDGYRPCMDCSSVFSDMLHRPYFCSSASLDPFVTNIPQANAIPRLVNLDAKTFSTQWADRPFILTEPVKTWNVYREWSINTLREKYGMTSFRAESVDWPLKTYLDYSSGNQDESPLYLFDHSFVEKMGLNVNSNGDYAPPACFGQDFFSELGESRPHHRWLILGPARSGSTFHKDPNATSAWNAVVSGRKYWIMFPSGSNKQRAATPPPGVFVSEDESEVTSPLSIMEWLLGFHAIARRTPGCLEGICQAGEVLHVPSGWWHLVVNLEETIAITQNFVPAAHLSQVLGFLQSKPTQVSGFSKSITSPYELFVRSLRQTCPAELELAMTAQERSCRQGKRKWEDLVTEEKNNEAGSAGFSFQFEDDEYDYESRTDDG